MALDLLLHPAELRVSVLLSTILSLVLNATELLWSIMLHTVNKYFVKTGTSVRVSLCSPLQCPPLCFPFPPSFLVRAPSGTKPLPGKGPSSQVTATTVNELGFFLGDSWMERKQNQRLRHPSFALSKIYALTEVLELVLCTWGTTHSRMPTHFISLLGYFLLCVLGCLWSSVYWRNVGIIRKYSDNSFFPGSACVYRQTEGLSPG